MFEIKASSRNSHFEELDVSLFEAIEWNAATGAAVGRVATGIAAYDPLAERVVYENNLGRSTRSFGEPRLNRNPNGIFFQRKWRYVLLMMRVGTVAAGMLFALSVGCGSEVFQCETHAQCPEEGVCEPSGFCSVLDEACTSGRRYVELSGSLSGECVPLDGESSSGGSSGTTPPTTSAGSTSVTPTTASEESSSEGDESSSGTNTDGNDPLLFVDDDADDFGAGVSSATVYDDGLRLQPEATSGTFVSRVFDAGASVSWTELGWVPRAPYSKALPDDGADEMGYAEGSVSMAQNVLLLHFDIGAGLIPGGDVEESSGQGHPVSLLGMGSLGAASSAPFAEGIALTPLHSIEVDVSGTADFQFGVSDYTWSMWARSSTPCYDAAGGVGSNQVYMGIEEDGDTGGAHLWLGCFNPAGTLCDTSRAGGYLGGTMTAAQGDDIGRICGGPDFIDGQWHHLAFVKSGHAEASLTLWIDGQQVALEAAEYVTPILFSPDRPFQIGRLGGDFSATVDLDEMSVFRRALQLEEIGDVYLRGALQLAFQVRACDMPTCEGVPFVGPDGDENTAYLDGPDGPAQELPALQGRYFQYSVRFGRDTPTLSREPILDEVRLIADPG